MHGKVCRICAVALLAGLAAGCSGLPDIDTFSFTSDAPDEREVRVHQVLSMPPDYQLRAPADGSAPVEQHGQANPYALPTLEEGGVLAAQQPPGDAAPADPNADPNAAPADPSQPGPQTIGPGTQTASAQQTQYPCNINPNNPDGTAKSPNEINQELRECRLEEERRRNPNYGTIFNIGNLFE